MEKGRQNVTLVIDEDLLLAARKVALDQRTSVNQLVREYLATLVEAPGRRRLARTRLKKAFTTGLVEVGDRKWSRDDLYDR
jgi:hypothetical protein